MEKVVISIFIIFIFFSMVGASVEVHESSSIISEYRVGDKLSGFFNISIVQEKINENLRFVFNNFEFKKPVKDFLDAYTGETLYTCDPSDCQNSFVKIGEGKTSETISVGVGNDKTVGFVINGNSVEILENGISFDVTSDASSSCSSQLSIDISADGEIDWENDKNLDESCVGEKTSSCYNSESFDSWFLIGEVPYCEKIKLGKAPAFDIKADIKWDGFSSYSSDLIIASIYGPDKTLKKSCNLGKPSKSGNEKTCFVDYISKSEEEHFVCISMKPGINNQGYSLKARDKGDDESFCGFRGDPGQVSDTSGDYSLRVSPREYDSVGSFNYNGDVHLEQTGSSLVSDINEYLDTNYGGKCPVGGCIIPIEFSGLEQKITIDNVEIKYKNSATNQVVKNNVYLLGTTPATLTTIGNDGFLILDLDNNEIDLPPTSGDYSLDFFIEDEKIFEENIILNEIGVPLIGQIHPIVVPSAINVQFLAFVDTSLDLSELTFKWNFNDGSLVKTSNEPKIVHTITSIGNYNLEVRALKDGEEITRANFEITSVAPKEAINKIVSTYKERINYVKIKRGLLPDTYKFYVDNLVNLGELESEVNGLESEYIILNGNEIGDEVEFVRIVNDLLDKQVPKDIRPSSRSEIKLIYDLNDLVLEDLSHLFNEVYQTSQENYYKNEIFKWFVENIDAKVEHKTYSIYFDNFKKNLISDFEITINPKPGLIGKGYLIIGRDSSDIIFLDNIIPSSSAGVTGIEVDLSQSSRLRFAIEEDINAFSLPIYFVPEFSNLDIYVPQTEDGGGEGFGFWKKFSIGLLIVLLLVFILYYFLQNWYKNNYERSLFKNRNDLYNLLYFIKNSKENKMKESDIVEKLSKVGWKREQINYSLKKFKGKKIGMWEIPIFKLFEKRKMNKELNKRKYMAKI